MIEPIRPTSKTLGRRARMRDEAMMDRKTAKHAYRRGDSAKRAIAQSMQDWA